MISLEVPVFSAESAALAVAQHARRLEVNRGGSYMDGGLTPTIEELRATLAAMGDGDENSDLVGSWTPVRVMIRPRGRPPLQTGRPDFVYTEAEFDGMVEAVDAFRESGLLRVERGDGFVFGCLAKVGGPEAWRPLEVDVVRNIELVGAAAPFPAVFHRAFDDIIGSEGCTIEEALQDLKHCGFHGLLTSGGPGSAPQNREVVAEIISRAPGKIREVIVGGGVRSTNAEGLKSLFTVPEGLDVWFHSSCLTKDFDVGLLDEEEVRATVHALF